MYANATYRLLKKCNSLSNTDDIRNCLSGPKMLDELKKTCQIGYTGLIQLDKNGDREGTFVFYQVLNASVTEREKTTLSFKVEEVASYLSGHEFKWLKSLEWKYHSPSGHVKAPRSLCSLECKLGESKIPKDVPCCWTCRHCRPNEFVTNNGRTCKACPQYYWPDNATNQTSCAEIPIEKLEFTNAKGIIMLLIAGFFLLCCLALSVFFVCYRERSIIQNSSPVLSSFVLVGVGLASVTSVSFQIEPAFHVCIMNFVLFCASFTLMYGPLLFRAVSIYYIYRLSQGKPTRFRLLSLCEQMLYPVGLVLVQVRWN